MEAAPVNGGPFEDGDQELDSDGNSEHQAQIFEIAGGSPQPQGQDRTDSGDKDSFQGHSDGGVGIRLPEGDLIEYPVQDVVEGDNYL